MTDLKDLVARLRAYGDHSATIGDMYRLERDCAAAADCIERLSGKAEPVARVNNEGFIVETGLSLAPGTLLYAHPAAPAPDAATVDSIMALADKLSMAHTCRDVPTGELYRGIAHKQWLEARAALRAAVEQLADAVTWVPVLRERAERAEQDAARLREAFAHWHVSNHKDDVCAECGLDLRDPVHRRLQREPK